MSEAVAANNEARSWRKFIFVCGKRCFFAFLSLILIGVIYEQWGRWRADTVFPPKGELVDVKGRKVHVLREGLEHDGPTVVFEAGITMPGTVDWGRVPSLVSKSCPTICYDRAGILHSNYSPLPRTSKQICSELYELLEALDETGPFILVGQSLGGNHVRVFADEYPSLVEGIVLVDIPHGDETDWPPRPGDFLTDTPWWVKPWYEFAANTGLLRIMIGNSGPQAHLPQSGRIMEQEGNGFLQSMADVRATGPLGDTPLVVITGRKPWDFPFLMSNEERIELQGRICEQSSNSKQIIAERSSHAVQWTEPELIAGAIKEMVDALRSEANR